MNRKAFPHLTDEQYDELLVDIAKGTPARKSRRFELYAKALKQLYPRPQDTPPVAKALADLMYIEAVNSDPALLDTLTKIGETE